MRNVFDRLAVFEGTKRGAQSRTGRMLMTVAFVSCVALNGGLEVQATPGTVEIRDRSVTPMHLFAVKGEPVHLTIVNEGKQVHNFVIPDFYIFTQNMQPGETVQVGFTPDKTGTYPFYSDTGGKPEPGISGTLRVRDVSGNP